MRNVAWARVGDQERNGVTTTAERRPLTPDEGRERIEVLSRFALLDFLDQGPGDEIIKRIRREEVKATWQEVEPIRPVFTGDRRKSMANSLRAIRSIAMANDKLVKKEETALAQNEAIPGLEHVDREDIVIPRFSFSGKSGMFENLLTTDVSKQVECVLLTRYKGRLKWGDDSKPDCRSKDRITGSKYGTCVTCQFAVWQDEMKTDQELRKQLCRPTYDFLLLLPGGNIPYMLSVKAPSSMGPAKKYTSSFIIQRRPLFSCTTVLSSEEHTLPEGKGSYYSLSFDRGAEIAPDDQKDYQALMDKYRIVDNVMEEVAGEKIETDLGGVPW